MSDPKTLQGLEDEDKVLKCPDCGCEDIGYKNEERYCKKCGLVLD
jgi:hypothetical protein